MVLKDIAKQCLDAIIARPTTDVSDILSGARKPSDENSIRNTVRLLKKHGIVQDAPRSLARHGRHFPLQATPYLRSDKLLTVSAHSVVDTDTRRVHTAGGKLYRIKEDGVATYVLLSENARRIYECLTERFQEPSSMVLGTVDFMWVGSGRIHVLCRKLEELGMACSMASQTKIAPKTKLPVQLYRRSDIQVEVVEDVEYVTLTTRKESV